MKTSTHRILTTHVGSLPRSKAVTDCVFSHEQGNPLPQAPSVIAQSVKDVVAKQLDARVDIVSDGEMSKISYATYIKDRITGFDGDSPRTPPRDRTDIGSRVVAAHVAAAETRAVSMTRCLDLPALCA